ncbi:hypothetical protein DSO57_1035519 [Entomophthora muscae]|uniref:Uncharacterized protein n=1 Tax=Entomophthora muscae TaxID=34485 RepID=A0ACC2SNY9_9FUNG|nr:hypothetical protein DSO57_1035519 [Entomophthora muscae]
MLSQTSRTSANKLFSRCFSLESHRALGAEKDSQYPGLYYYQYQKEGLKLASYLSFVPPSLLGKDAVLSPKQIIAKIPDLPKGMLSKNIPASDFSGNSSFMKQVQEFLKKSVAISDRNLIALAQYQKQGWLHIGDNRNPPPFGRIPDPEDIFGSILAVDGLMLQDTYQPMPAHRPLTSQNGLFQLPEGLRELLLKELLQ